MALRALLLAAPVGAVHVSRALGDGLVNKSCTGAGCTDPCECMKWTDVYAPIEGSPLAACGDGMELMAGESKGLPAFLAHKYLDKGFCKEFFMKLDDNECVNVVHDTAPGHWWSGHEWCWVSVACPLASEISPSVDIHAKVKFCGETDLALSHFSMEGLIDYAETEDIDLGLAVKMAFGVSHQLEWGHFQATFMSEHCADYALGGVKKHLKGKAQLALQSDLEAILKKHQTKEGQNLHGLVLVNDGIPPYGVITTAAIWECYAEDPTIVTHPNEESICVCLCGLCPE